jgi:hypothetical protein
MYALVFAFVLAACDSNPPTTIPTASVAARTPAAAATDTLPDTVATAPTAVLPSPTTALVVTATAPTSAPTHAPTAAPAIVTATRTGLDMHAVDWMKVVTTDPNLQYDSSIAPPPELQRAPWVQLKSNSDLQGHALIDLDRILFVDISGDGQEEAIISIFSGGTAGNFGLLVYTVANRAPILADSVAGYKIGGTADGKLLKVTEPIYQGWEPNCCPSGFFETRYRLQANRLVQVSRDEKPIPEARTMSVDKYYELLLARNYADAYDNFLSASYRASHPFANWSAGYANTLSFVATTSDNPDGSVKVDLVSHDKAGTGEVIHHYIGTWRLKWVSTARFKQWVLDSGNFVEVK